MECTKCQDGFIYTCRNCDGDAIYDYEYGSAFCDRCEMLKERYSISTIECSDCNFNDENSLITNKKNLLFFDTETTGLPRNWKAPISDIHNWPRLVQLAYQLYDEDGSKLKEVDFIIYPDGYLIPSESSSIHKITNEIAKSIGQPIEKVLSDFFDSLKSAHTIIGHNIDFDINVVGCEFIRLGMQNPFETLSKICTMESSTAYCAIQGPYGYKWPKLAELYFKLFNNELEDAHDARIDIKATIECFWELKNRNIIQLNGLNKESNNLNNQSESIRQNTKSKFGFNEPFNDIVKSEDTIEAKSAIINFLKENNLNILPIGAQSFAISYFESKLRQSNNLESLSAKIDFLKDFWLKHSSPAFVKNLNDGQNTFIQSVKKSIILPHEESSTFIGKNEEKQIDSLDLIGLLFSIENKQSRDLVIYLYYYYLYVYIDYISSNN
jgi:DNA polymerase III epsilon subunit-like protein